MNKTKKEIKKLSEQTYKLKQEIKPSRPHAPSWTYGFQIGYEICQGEAKEEIERLREGIEYVKDELFACADMGVIAKSAHVLRYIESLLNASNKKGV